MFINQCLVQLLSDGHHPATDESRCRDQQPNVRQNQVNPTEEEEDVEAKGVKDTMRTHLQHQLNRAHRKSQKLKQ